MSKIVKLLLILLYIIPSFFFLITLFENILPNISNLLYIKEQDTIKVEKLSITHNDTRNTHNQIKLMFTGDIMLGRTVMTKSIEENNWEYPVTFVADKLSSADVTFINLENPVVEYCPNHTSGFTFCSPLESLQALTKSGVDIVTLANNHTLNYGRDGLEDTVKHLEGSGIKVTGLNKLVVIEKNRTKFGFLGFDLVTNKFGENMNELINDSVKKVDFLIVGVHWGAEYQPAGGRLQRQWAREFVKAGADLIIGHHPHWVQDSECIDKNALEIIASNNREKIMTPGNLETCPGGSVRVYYSLGNFVFDQMWSEETKKGLAVEVTVENGQIIKEEMLPIFMQNWAQPEFNL